ncbi:MAG: DNA-processing protein DprA [Candidatus Cloacimonetes bacterium]|nr:DNA-processing protein DprA [Candidatus Cloacimonadota bacterium]
MLIHAAYWITIAHLPKWTIQKINTLIKNIYVVYNSNLEEFFASEITIWKSKYELGETDILTLSAAKFQIANNAFLAENLYNQGFEIVPLNDADYPPILKANLKLSYSPPVLYIKGNKILLKEDSIAIVGSRNASESGLAFTDTVAKNASDSFQVVVSGFAKGIDKAALDSALKYHGHSIIVLPQGVLTFGSGYKKYYKPIIDGDLLVLSTFHPKAPWKVELAMARNPIIYGMANSIFVAESSDSGGTWSGVKDGLPNGRTIFVRKQDIAEANANDKLISLGAIAVDSKGKIIEEQSALVKQIPEYQTTPDFAERIIAIVSYKALSSKEICVKLECNWTTRQMTDYLKEIESIEVVKQGKVNKYKLRNTIDSQQTIDFDCAEENKNN